MSKRVFTLVSILAAGLFVGNAWACPKNAKCGKQGAKLVKADAAATDAKAPCSKKCHKKGNADATLAGAKAPCSKKCHKKSVVLTADGPKTKKCPLTGKPIAEKDCPISKKVKAVLASLPSMKYRVGTETTCCSKAAGDMAKSAGKPIQYVVGEDVFDKEGEATVKLASLLEAEVEALQTMQFATAGKCFRCPVTAKSVAKKSNDKVVYRVGGVDFNDKEKAEKVVKLVSDKLADVAMSYKVGEKSFCCDKMAGSEVKQSGKKMLYIVDGEETACPTTAKVNLAHAKIRKIVETAATAL